jgi:hypothetical protein
MRAETLFHEARHSDGHGKTLGFLHAKCPSYHDYAGLPACDLSTNGPYTIGALMFKYIMDSTADKSTEKTKKIQQLIYLDIANRTLSTSSLVQSPETAAGTDWDDAPEMLEKN